MSQLTMYEIPGFFDIADSTLVGGQPLTDDTLTKISHNAKFSAVRNEVIYMGYYAHGNTVPVPQSPVDGYQYSYPELFFVWTFALSRAPAPGFVPGQAAFPTAAGINAGAGNPLVWFVDINDANGLVSIQMDYYVQNGAQTNTNDGCLKVYAVCQRSSVNLPLGVSSD